MVGTSKSRSTPIFVLGVQRSGTTWLANILAQNSRVAAVQADDHFGIHESIFFSHFAKAYGDLRDNGNFQRFIRAFTTSDYFVLTGLEPAWLMTNRARTYPALFRAVMEEVASRRDSDFWVEKSPAHTLLAEELAASFPDARFVGVVRATRATIASQLWLPGRPPPYPMRAHRLVGMSLRCAQQRWLRKFCQRRPETCLLTTYEALARDAEAETRRICDFLGVDYEPTMLDLPWRRNTSFGSTRGRRRSLSRSDELVVIAACGVLRFLPASAIRWLITKRRARRGVQWPEWCWRRLGAGQSGEHTESL